MGVVQQTRPIQMGEPDEDLRRIEGCLAGDPEAFGALVERYQHMVHVLAYRMTGSTADAEDLAQETFIRAYDRLGSFRGVGRFSSWLGRITIHLCINWARQQQRIRELHATWDAETHGDTTSNPGALDYTGERQERVQWALMRLPAKQRAAVVLTLQEGLSHAEAARILGCSETTVSWRLFAARAKLKRWLS
jgi:RNA polymerase sigma-70 factor, ECF subfamily